MDKTIEIIDKELSSIYEKQVKNEDISLIKEEPKFQISYYTTKASIQKIKQITNQDLNVSFDQIKKASSSDSDLTNFLIPGSSEDPDEVNMKNPDYYIFRYQYMNGNNIKRFSDDEMSSASEYFQNESK